MVINLQPASPPNRRDWGANVLKNTAADIYERNRLPGDNLVEPLSALLEETKERVRVANDHTGCLSGMKSEIRGLKGEEWGQCGSQANSERCSSPHIIWVFWGKLTVVVYSPGHHADRSCG